MQNRTEREIEILNIWSMKFLPQGFTQNYIMMYFFEPIISSVSWTSAGAFASHLLFQSKIFIRSCR